MILRSRSVFLSIIGLSIFFTAAKWAIAPIHRTYVPILFPEKIEIRNWQQQDQSTLTSPLIPSSRYDQLLSGKTYHYTQSQISLQVEFRDLFTTTGDINQFLKMQLQLDLEPLQSHDYPLSSGYYRIFTTHDQTYLSSCLDAQGRATVTPEQFRHHRHHQDWRGDRLLRWAIGQTSLIEQRCLWVLMSIPTHPDQSDANKAMLQQVWQDHWEQWHTLLQP